MPVTILDVAKAAGVSIKTVSRVVNKESNVSIQTRDKVLSAIEQLGYTPNPSAQRLARGHTGIVGLLIHDTAPTFVMEVLKGIMDMGELRSYHFSLHRCDVTKPEQVSRVIRMAAQHQVGGLIFTPPCDTSDELIEALQAIQFPFVILMSHDRSPHKAWVVTENEQGSFDLTCHLLELGHRSIGFIQGNADHQDTWDRLAGYKRALQHYGLDFDPTLLRHGVWTSDSGQEHALDLLAKYPETGQPTAIVATNDEMASGVIQAIRQLGLRCPEDISVVGFDNVPLASQLSPPLTTIHQPIREMAARAMEIMIDDFLEGDGIIRHVEMKTRLVIRQSTMRRSPL
jgi:LacI family transcriptional regulator